MTVARFAAPTAKRQSSRSSASEEWQADLRDIADRLTASCRAVDPASTDEVIQMAHAADVVEGETTKVEVSTAIGETKAAEPEADFAAGLFD